MKKLSILLMLLLTIGALVLPAAAQEDESETPPDSPLLEAIVEDIFEEAQPIAESIPAQPIFFGDPITAELDSSNPALRYRFVGDANQAVIITQQSQDLDSYLVLSDANGVEITVDDDSGAESFDSRIGPFVLPAAGEYIITATSHGYYNFDDASALGQFTVMVDEIDVEPMEYTQTKSGELETPNAQAFYSFRGQQGDLIEIDLIADNFDAHLSLLEPGELQFPLGEDWGYGTDPAIIAGLTLPVTGDYLINVSSLEMFNSGEFDLRLNRATVNELVLNEPSAATITSEEPTLYYSFEGSAGDVFDVVVDSGETLDTTLTINDPDGFQVGYNDDFGGIDPTLTDFILPQDGVYTVLIQPFSTVDVATEINVTLTAGEIMSLDSGEQGILLGYDAPTDILSFTGTAGEMVRLVVRSDNDEGITISPSVTVDQNQFQIVYASVSNVQQQAFDFVIPEDGEVIVRVEDYSGLDDLAIIVELERLSE